MDLFQRDSVEDLALRGFPRDEIIKRTGFDPGYNNRKLRTVLSGIDRTEYKAAYVLSVYDDAHIRMVLHDYADGCSKDDVLSRFGLAGDRMIQLKDLFLRLGYFDEFHTADRNRRNAQMKSGFVSAYGTDNPFKMSQFQDAARDTRRERYGGDYTLSHDSVLADSARETYRNHMKDDVFSNQVSEKRKESMQESYGVDYPFQSAELREKARETMIRRYGVPHFAQTPEYRAAQSVRMKNCHAEILEKARVTMLQRYGVANWSQTQQGRANLSRIMSDKQEQHRRLAVKMEKGTVKSSKPEELLYDVLCSVFGSDDVIRQHVDVVRYPWCCDFYIVSRDMFIELNGTWTHGGHWFGSGLCDDDVVSDWSRHQTEYYELAKRVWTQDDVEKRRCAESHELNYIVFWDVNVWDAELWITMGCPDGTDWRVEYSWMSQRFLSMKAVFPDALCSSRSYIQAVKAANGLVFYDREIRLWNGNEGIRKGRIQGALYANRYHYLGKLPDQLSDMEIVRGLSIGGFVKGYTSFDVIPMLQVFDRYGVRSVYDPCSGWGERLAACGNTGIWYTGCDVNPKLQDGYKKLVEQYGFENVQSVCADASKHDMRMGEHDTVFTCPPYGSREIYTEHGAENLSGQDFIDWWSDVASMSVSDTTVRFMYQIDQKHKAAMNQVLLDNGWTLKEQIPVGQDQVRHENRARGILKKKNYEEIQVFVR